MQRIQKFLADQGIGSRREIESWIKLSRIKVNNQIAILGTKVNGSEKISLDGKILITTNKINQINGGTTRINDKLINSRDIKIILYNKPVGKICTRSDPNNRPTVFMDLPKLQSSRCVAVGRLDLNTSGLMLFTNNGDLANKLMHPSYNQEREYMVRVFGNVTPQIKNNLIKGIKLSEKEGVAKFKTITFVKQKNANAWYKVVLTEGKNKEVKRLFASQGLVVNRLIRIRFGDILLPMDLKAGEYKFINYLAN